MPGTWVVTRKYKCLHIVGNCYREPGVHYIHFEAVKTKVEKDMFRAACGVCFPLGWPLFEPAGPELVEEELAEGMPREAAIEDGESSDSVAE